MSILLTKWITDFLYVSVNKNFMLLRRSSSTPSGERLKDVFLFQMSPRTTQHCRVLPASYEWSRPALHHATVSYFTKDAFHTSVVRMYTTVGHSHTQILRSTFQSLLSDRQGRHFVVNTKIVLTLLSGITPVMSQNSVTWGTGFGR